MKNLPYTSIVRQSIMYLLYCYLYDSVTNISGPPVSYVGAAGGVVKQEGATRGLAGPPHLVPKVRHSSFPGKTFSLGLPWRSVAAPQGCTNTATSPTSERRLGTNMIIIVVVISTIISNNIDNDT